MRGNERYEGESLRPGKKKVTKEEGRVDNCQQRISELERYSRRWNLRLHGVKEAEKEDVRGKVIEICQSVLPEQNHRLPDVIDTDSEPSDKVAPDPEASSCSSPPESTEMLYGKQPKHPPTCRTIISGSLKICPGRTENVVTNCGR